jgi:hypothetical protein
MIVDTPPPEIDPATDRRRARWDQWRWLRDRSCRGGAKECMTPLGGEVTLGVTAAGAVHVGGIKRCGSVWACPHCAPVRREKRATAIDTLIRRALDHGCEVRFVTATVSHHNEHTLAHVGNAVQDCWSAAFSGRAMYPGRIVDEHKITERVNVYGVDAAGDCTGEVIGDELVERVVHREEIASSWYWGQIRAFDLTDGANGWHPHIHAVLVFAPGTPEPLIDEWLLERRRKYRKALTYLGLYAAADRRGWDVRDCRSYDNTDDAIARYLTKVDGGWGIGLELARMDLKSARRKGSTPFQLLVAATVGDQAAARRFLEYERWSTGRKLTVTSRRLVEIFRVDVDQADEDTDGDDATVDPADEFVYVHRIAGDGWWRLALKGQIPDLYELVRATAHNRRSTTVDTEMRVGSPP